MLLVSLTGNLSMWLTQLQTTYPDNSNNEVCVSNSDKREGTYPYKEHHTSITQTDIQECT